MEESVDGAELASASLGPAVERLIDTLVRVDQDGWYAALEVTRPWSVHNPQITGEFAGPSAVRRYLRRELTALLRRGATVTARPSRRALAFDDPAFFSALDEEQFDLRAKKLFLFGPERMALSLDRLSHYCGTPAGSFERHVMFTNYPMHVDAFRARFRMRKARTGRCRCRPGIIASRLATGSAWSTSGSVRQTPRRSPTIWRCCARTPC